MWSQAWGSKNTDYKIKQEVRCNFKTSAFNICLWFICLYRVETDAVETPGPSSWKCCYFSDSSYLRHAAHMDRGSGDISLSVHYQYTGASQTEETHRMHAGDRRTVRKWQWEKYHLWVPDPFDVVACFSMWHVNECNIEGVQVHDTDRQQWIQDVQPNSHSNKKNNTNCSFFSF